VVESLLLQMAKMEREMMRREMIALLSKMEIAEVAARKIAQ